MPVMVIFGKNGGQLNEVRQECGPYRTAQLSGDVLYTFDGFDIVRLAIRTPAGWWEVNGLPGLEFETVLFMPPVEEARAELDALAAEEDDD